jgi:hypothetical protein
MRGIKGGGNEKDPSASYPMEAQWTIPVYRVGAFNRVSYVTTLYPIVTAYYESG